MTTLLVCGSRKLVLKRWALYSKMATLIEKHLVTRVIHGDAEGADKEAARLAASLGIDTVAYPADWKRHGKAAGPIRNQRMLDEGRPDLVLAIRNAGESRGTDDMITRARKAGIPVLRVLVEGPETYSDEWLR